MGRSAGATTYTFDLDRPVSENVTLTGLTPEADTDGLACTESNCTLTISDPATVLTENGLYSWTVTASNTTGDTAASNNPFTFTVDLTVGPGEFNLLSPANNSLIRNPANLTEMTWGLSDGAAVYNFILIKLSDNTTLGIVLDLNIPTEDCGPNQGVCTLVITPEIQALLSDGQYSWTVVAHLDETTNEAENAPYFFTVNTGALALVSNGGFESKTIENKPELSPWVGKNLTGDKIKCNKETKIIAHTGECAFRFKGSAGENSKILQTVDDTIVFQNEFLTLSLYANTNIEAAGKIAMVKVKYQEPDAGQNSNGKDKLQLELSAPTANGEYELFTGQIQMLGTPIKVKVLLVNTSVAGKLYIDDVQVEMTTGAAMVPGAGLHFNKYTPANSLSNAPDTYSNDSNLIPLP